MSMALKNIKNLVKVQFIQKMYILYLSIILSGISMFLSLYSYFNLTDVNYAVINISDKKYFIAILIIPFISVLSTNILSNSEIKMYPGTVQTRYLSRIITDHIFIILSYVTILLSNILLNLIIVIDNSSDKALDTSALFDYKYFLKGFVVYISLSFVIYMATVFINIILSRVSSIVLIISLGIIFLLLLFKIIPIDNILSVIDTFYFSYSLTLSEMLIRFIITWIVLLIIGYILTYTFKYWYDEFNKSKEFIIHMTMLIIFTFFSIIFYISVVEYKFKPDYLIHPDNNNSAEYYMDIPKDFNKSNVNYVVETNNYKYPHSVRQIDYDTAVKLGIITEDTKIPEDKILVHIFAPKEFLNGKVLNENLIDSVEFDFDNQMVRIEQEFKTYAVNAFLGNFYSNRKDSSFTHSTFENDNYMQISIILIYNK